MFQLFVKSSVNKILNTFETFRNKKKIFRKCCWFSAEDFVSNGSKSSLNNGYFVTLNSFVTFHDKMLENARNLTANGWI